MLPYRDSRFMRLGLLAFFLILAAYAYYEAHGVLEGPVITISGRAMETSQPLIRIQGKAERIASLSMNGTAISVSENGEFDEPYLLAPGYNRIVLDARDKYGKTSERVIEIIYRSTATSTAPRRNAAAPRPLDAERADGQSSSTDMALPQ